MALMELKDVTVTFEGHAAVWTVPQATDKGKKGPPVVE